MAFVNDEQMEQNEEKSVLDKLKRIQSLEKISNDEKAPETASAAKMLIERLKQPRQPQRDLSPLIALTSPNVAQRLAQVVSKPSAFSQEEQRLSKAAELENSLAKLSSGGAKYDERVNRQDQQLYNRIIDTVSGNRRSPQLRSLYTSLDAVDAMETKLSNAMRSGRLLYSDAADISSEWSRALTGGVPSQSLIEMTMPNTIYGKYGNLKTFLSSNPDSQYYTPEVMEHMMSQLQLLKGSRQKALGKAINRTVQPHRSLFERRPDLAQDFSDAYEPYLRASIQDDASKAANASGEVEVISPDGQEGSIPAEDLEQALREGFKRK